MFSDSVWYEESSYIATHIASIAYGIHVTLYVFTTYYSFLQRGRLKTWPYWLTLNTVQLTFGTVALACAIKFDESAWITERDYPGGSFRFLLDQQSRPVMTLGNTASVICSLLTEGVLLYRLMVLYNYSFKFIIFPILCFLFSIAFCIMVVIQIAKPTVSIPVSLAMPAWVTLMGVNVLLAGMIVARLFYNRHKITTLLGPGQGKIYLDAAALVIEGAMPFLILSAILLGLFGGNSTTQNLFIPLIIQVECVSSELIALRVLRGRLTPNLETTTTLNEVHAPRKVFSRVINITSSGQRKSSDSSQKTAVLIEKEQEIV